MPFTLCASEAIVTKAGANASTTAAASSAIMEQFSNDAESEVVNQSRYDWVTNWASLDAVAKLLLSSACSNIAAMYLVSYDMSGYRTGEATTLLNVLDDRAQKALTMIKEDKNRAFIK